MKGEYVKSALKWEQQYFKLSFREVNRRLHGRKLRFTASLTRISKVARSYSEYTFL